MDMKEKQLYGIILVLAVALASVGGYLIAIVQQGQLGQYSPSTQHSEPKVYPIIIGGQEQGTQLRTIAVAGLGRASAKPNLAELRLGAATQSSTATEALAKNAESMNKVIEALKVMGIPEKDIETAYFGLYPTYSSDGTLTGYEVTHMLRVSTLSLDKVGQIIDKSVEAGANRVETVYFTFTEDKLEELNTLARQRAVGDARAKAETVASSLGVKIVGVAGAVEETYYSPYYYEYGMVVPVPTPTPIMPPTEVEVTVAIRVTFMIE